MKRARKAPQSAEAVVPVDGEGNYVLTPEGFTVYSTPIDQVELYLSHKELGIYKGSVAFHTLERNVREMLRAVVGGKEPAKVFRRVLVKKHGERDNKRRNQAMCLEVLRLTQLRGIGEPAAKDAVAAAFSKHLKRDIDVRLVERALSNWRNHQLFSEDHVRNYECNLTIWNLLV